MITRIAIFFVGSLFLLAVIVPWNSNAPGSSPYVSAFKAMGIPAADHIMNAVVQTAVLSCLNSGLYTASRMLFVLAARREAPMQLIRVSGRGVPRAAILTSTVVGFLCVIAAAVSPNTVFLFLLNSSGAIILFVYLLISVSQVVLRGRTPPEKLKVKMWLYPALSILTILGVLAVLVQMGLDAKVRPQLVLSLLSWAAVLVLYFVTKWRGGSIDAADVPRATPSGEARRVLVLANETVSAAELIEELRRIDQAGHAQYFVCVPANPVDTGQPSTRGRPSSGRRPLRPPSSDWTAPSTSCGPKVCRPKVRSATTVRCAPWPMRWRASTPTSWSSPPFLDHSTWLRYDVVDRARSTYDMPVTRVIATALATAAAATS